MSIAVARRRTAGGRIADGSLPRSSIVLRTILQRTLLFALLRVVCTPMRVERDTAVRADRGPFIFVANHASHADTALIVRALPTRLRRQTATAAADDYFFRSRIRGALVSALVGAFPFPRRGRAGLERAASLLASGRSVLLFPEGTRSRDGRVARFKAGATRLAALGYPIVPIGVAGTAEVLPKGVRLPRRRPVSVVFGAPMQIDASVPADVEADRIRRRVSRLHAAARLLRPAPRRTWFDRARALARSRTGMAVVFGWAVAEALFAPVVPDVPVVLLVVAAPERFVALAAAATTGSLAGGVVAYGLGAAGAGGWLLAHAPLVTDRMGAHAAESLHASGASTFLGQPWTGIPYKVFAYRAAPAGIALGSYVWASFVGRGARILVVSWIFALAAEPFTRRWERWVRLAYAPFVVIFCFLFSLALARVVAAWS